MATIPSPFTPQDPAKPAIDAKTPVFGEGAKPISGPGAAPDPAPVVPPRRRRAPPPVPVAPAAATGPAPVTPPAPPPAQKMVPAYIAKAMERQTARLEKENAMVPAPAEATPTTLGKTAADGSAPAPAAEPVGSDGYTDAQRAEVEAGTASANAQKLGEISSVDQTQVGATPTQPTGLEPDPADTPDVAAQKSSTQQRTAELTEMAKTWMTAKEDPAFVRQFNQTMLDTAIQNQAAVDATKRMIAQNPSLRGQPAGDALLGLKAIQLGMEVSDLKANMSVAHARAVSEMNRIGFDAYYKLNKDQMTQDDNDIELYGSVMDRMISSGADEATLRAYYDKNIAPLLGGKDITFDQFRSPAERQRILSQVQDDGMADMRDALDRGDTAGALAALEAAYSPAKQLELGTALVGKNDLETINKWLEDAGYDTVESLADLIGREDDVFVGSEISKAKAKINESPMQPKVDALLKVLQGRGMDITDPEVIDAVEEYIYQQEFGDPENPNVLPWDDDATSWKYKDWEIFNPRTGDVVSAGGEFYDENNPEPAPGSEAYEWTKTLNAEWQKYLNSTRGEDRLSRDDWFANVKDAYTKAYQDKPDVTLGDFFARGDFKPDAPPQDPGDKTLNAAAIKDEIGALADAAALSEWLNDPDNIEAAVTSGAIANYPTPASLPTSAADWDAIDTAGGLINLDGKVYQIEEEGGSAVRNIGGIGDVVVLTDYSTDPPTKFVMKVNKAGSTPVEKVGYMVPINADGTWQFVPGGKVRGGAPAAPAAPTKASTSTTSGRGR